MKSYRIKILPSDRLFEELGMSNYDFVDVLSEFIDNSISASAYNEHLEISIQIGVSDENPMKNFVKVKDNAAGIKKANIANALSPAGTSGGAGLNEHGLGMKQAIYALGNLGSICTKTIEDENASLISELKFGDIEVSVVDVDFAHGTVIKVNNTVNIPNRHQSYGQKVIPVLGARYRRYIDSGVNISLVMWDIDNDREKIRWSVRSVRPLYFHPTSRDNMPIYRKKALEGDRWKAELTFGYAPSLKEAMEMGKTLPPNYAPYHVSLRRQGLDIIANDRVVKFHQLSEINLVSNRHSNYNYIRGEIDLIEGFKTSITKNGVIQDRNFNELIQKVKNILDKGSFLSKKAYPSDLPEKLLKDRLANRLNSQVFRNYNHIEKESHIEGLEGYVDIVADEHAFELKKGDANGSDVYQLFSYLDIGNMDKGCLVAKGFKESALYVAQYLEDMYGKCIELITIEDMGIDYPMSERDIKEYC